MPAESDPDASRAPARLTPDDAAEAAIARLRATAAAGSRPRRSRRTRGVDERAGPAEDTSIHRAPDDRRVAGRGTVELVDVVEAIGLRPTPVGVVALVAAALVVLALGVGCGWVFRSTTPADGSREDDPFAAAAAGPVPAAGTALPTGAAGTVVGEVGEPSAVVPERVAVHAAGAVAVPGVVEVAAGARVADVVAAAGGAVADADLDRVNLAAPVADGQRIYVPHRGELAVPDPVGPDGAASPGGGATSTSGSDPSGATATDRIDLNRATQTELEALPGIGPTLASAIVEHRTRNGPFRTVQGLLDVPGIGDARLAQLQDLVTVGP